MQGMLAARAPFLAGVTLVATWLLYTVRGVPVTLAEIKAQTSLKSSNAWSKTLVVGAATNYNEADDWYWELFKHHFDITTAENGCKMKQILWTEGKYKFAKCDSIVIDRLSVPWRGHALIWGATDSTLNWMPSQGGAAKNASEMTAFIQDYVETVLTYYKSKRPTALCWDTVNEAVKDTASGTSSIDDALKVNDYSAAIGSSYIGIALDSARRVDPAMKIFYNDYRILWKNDKSDAVYNVLKHQLDSGHPLDGIGFQSHLKLDFISSGAADLVKENFKRFAMLGLDIHITELDVGCNFMSRYKVSGCEIPWSTGGDGVQLAVQASIYETVLRSCLEIPACKVFEMWGFTDHTFESLPYLFDTSGKPKPAYDSVLSLLQQDPASGCEAVLVVKYNLPIVTTSIEMLTSCASSFAGGCSTTGWTAKGSGVVLAVSNSSTVTTVPAHDSDGHFLAVSGRSKGWQGAELAVELSETEHASGTPVSLSLWVQPAAVHPTLSCSSFAGGCTTEWSAGGSATIAAKIFAEAHDGDSYVGLVSGRGKNWQGATIQVSDKSVFVSGAAATISVWLRLPQGTPASAATFSLRLKTRGSSDTSDFMQVVASVESLTADKWVRLAGQVPLQFEGSLSTFKVDIATNEANAFTSYLVDDFSVSTGPSTTFRLKLITQGSGDGSSSTKIVTSLALDAGVWTRVTGSTTLSFTGASLTTLKVGLDTTGESSSFTDFYVDDASVVYSKTGHDENAVLQVVDATGNAVMSYNSSTLTPGVRDYWESSCVASGHYSVVAAAVGGTSSGWGAGAFVAVEDRDGNSLVSKTPFESGASLSKSFMVGKSARCTVPTAEDGSGVDYSKCYGKKKGWKCVVGCQDGYMQREGEDDAVFYCATSGTFVGTTPNCSTVEGLAGIATGVLAQMSTTEIAKKMTSSELQGVLKVLEEESNARGGSNSSAAGCGSSNSKGKGASSSTIFSSFAFQLGVVIVGSFLTGMYARSCVIPCNLGGGGHKELKEEEEEDAVEMGGGFKA